MGKCVWWAPPLPSYSCFLHKIVFPDFLSRIYLIDCYVKTLWEIHFETLHDASDILICELVRLKRQIQNHILCFPPARICKEWLVCNDRILHELLICIFIIWIADIQLYIFIIWVADIFTVRCLAAASSASFCFRFALARLTVYHWIALCWLLAETMNLNIHY